jgi:NAD+ synthase (glutamine-hydrolysing)
MVMLRVALAQLDCVVGDLDGNVDRMIAWAADAAAVGADVVVFPELAITGYPPEDLLLKPTFVDDNLDALQRLASATADGPVLVVGFVDRTGADGTRVAEVDGAAGAGLFNAAAVCARGAVAGRYHKRRLPNYAVFDEDRYFEPRSGPTQLFTIGGATVGVSVCEDAWAPDGPVAEASRAGARVVLNLNASPYHRGKVQQRERMLADRALEAGCPVAYVNLVGGQDELVFDGASMVVDAEGRVVARAPQYVEHLLVVDLEVGDDHAGIDESPSRGAVPVTPALEAARTAVPAELAPLLPPVHEIYAALVLGTRDYVRKNGFSEVVIGLSGGIDSSLVAAVAVDALGAENVHGVLMPSRYSSDHSLTDAELLARNLGIDHRTIAIEPAHLALTEMLGPSFAGTEPGLTEENLQPRIRGTLLMALSNKFGWLVLTTGNKSEMAVGYATLYGDMAGGFAVIKDVPKTVVYELCADCNERAGREIVPVSVIEKPPSAELRPDQLDTDSLPPYDLLDAILDAYIEDDRTAGDLIESGAFDEALVRRVVRMVDINEYKRRQAPPGVRVTTKAFGKDRRLPITNRYRG